MTRAIMVSKKEILLQSLISRGIIKLSNFRSDNLNCKKYRSLDEMVKLYADIDTIIAEKKNQNNVDFICKKGCHDCCNAYFYISKLEYFTIRHYLDVHRADIPSYVRESERLCAALRYINQQEHDKLADGACLFIDDFDDRALQAFNPCLFLSNGECGIYPVRPIICRLHGISYTYAYCEKVARKCLKWFSSNKLNPKLIVRHAIDLPYGDEFRIGVDYIRLSDRDINVSKPRPLFWWFANDAEYVNEYLSFVGENNVRKKGLASHGNHDTMEVKWNT